MTIIIKHYILVLTLMLKIHGIYSSQTPSTFTTLPKPLLPPSKSLTPSPSPSPSPHHHHSTRHSRHKYPLPQAPQRSKHGHLFFPPAPSPSPDAPLFPDNTSSLTPPPKNSSKSSTKLIIIIISTALFSVAIIAYASVLLIQHRRRHLQQQNPEPKMEKSDSVRLFPPNAPASDTTSLSYNSPDLRPLPPLPKQNPIDQQSYYNSAYEANYHDEEFFSPLAVSGSPNLELSSSCSVTGADNFRSHSLNSEITSSRSASISQPISRCPSVASTSTSRTPTQESSVQFSIPQRNVGFALHSDEVESVDFPLNPPLLPTPRLTKMWLKSEGTGNVSPELGFSAKTLTPNPPLKPPPRLRKLWFESEGTSNVSPELEIPVKPLPTIPPLSPSPRLRKMWFGSEGTSNVSPGLEISAKPITDCKENEGGETSERNL